MAVLPCPVKPVQHDAAIANVLGMQATCTSTLARVLADWQLCTGDHILPAGLAALLSMHLRTEGHPTAMRRSLAVLIHLASFSNCPQSGALPAISAAPDSTRADHELVAGMQITSAAPHQAAQAQPGSQHAAAAGRPAGHISSSSSGSSSQQQELLQNDAGLGWQQAADIVTSSSHVVVCCMALRLLGHAVRQEVTPGVG